MIFSPVLVRCSSVRICSVSDTFHAIQRPAQSRSPRAACLVSGADRCSVSSVRARVSCLAWSALHLVRPVLLPVMCSRSGCAGVLGSPPAGYTGSTGSGVVDTSRRKNSKKAFFGVRAANTHPTFTNQNPSDCASLQKFRKIQKDPFRSLDCGIIS